MLGSWSEHVDELLYDGEREREHLELENATVVVTNHRVLVFTPENEGKNYRDVERPNITRITMETDSSPRQLFWASVTLLLGVGAFVAAVTYDLSALVENVDETGDPTGTVDSVLEGLQTILAVLDISILVAGGVLVLLAGLFLARYILSREQLMLMRVSGEEDISITITDTDLAENYPVKIEKAITPGTETESDELLIEPGPEADPDPGHDRNHEFDPEESGSKSPPP